MLKRPEGRLWRQSLVGKGKRVDNEGKEAGRSQTAHGILRCGSCQSPQGADTALGSLVGRGNMESHLLCGGCSISGSHVLIALQSPKKASECQDLVLNPKACSLEAHALT